MFGNSSHDGHRCWIGKPAHSPPSNPPAAAATIIMCPPVRPPVRPPRGCIRHRHTNTILSLQPPMSLSETCSLYVAHKDLSLLFVATFAESRPLASMAQPTRVDSLIPSPSTTDGTLELMLLRVLPRNHRLLAYHKPCRRDNWEIVD